MKSYTHFTLEERKCLEQSLKEHKSIRAIARELNRSPSSVSREIKRNYSKRKNHYNAWRATTLYIIRRRNCKRELKISSNPHLYKYINQCLCEYWPPETIAAKCNEKGFQISFSTIYSAVRRGEFANITPKTHLRRRGKRQVKSTTNCATIHPIHTIHERPLIVEQKLRFGDWEGDTVYGAKGKSCLVTLVERKSKFVLAVKCKNRNASNIRKAFAKAFRMLKIDHNIHTITLDNGSEFAEFEKIEQDLQTTIYFCDVHSPWQRGLNENTNDMIRFFFPKGTDFNLVTDEEIASVIALINNRPRKCLDFLSPIEFINSKCCT